MENYPHHSNFNIELTITIHPVSFHTPSIVHKINSHWGIAEFSTPKHQNTKNHYHSPSLGLLKRSQRQLLIKNKKHPKNLWHPIILNCLNGRERCAALTAITQGLRKKNQSFGVVQQQPPTKLCSSLFSWRRDWTQNWTLSSSPPPLNCPELTATKMPEIKVDKNGNLKPPIGL